MDREIKCIFINANSLIARHRRHYLNIFIGRNRPDIVMIAEHKLNHRHKLEIKGYRSYRQNRTKGRGGGTAILIREIFDCERVHVDTGNIESTFIRVRRLNGGRIILGALYLKPMAAVNDSDLDAISNVIAGDEAILGGDLNCKHPHWGGSVNNRNGTRLYDWMLSSPNLMVKGTRDPTRVTCNGASYIDLFIVTLGLELTGESLSNDGLITRDFESDHRAVELSFRVGRLGRIEQGKVFDYSSFKCGLFNRKLMDGLDGCMLPEDRNATIVEIDNAVDNLTSAYNEAMGSSMRMTSPVKHYLPRLPHHIIGFIAQKRTMLRRLHRTLEIEGRNTLRAIIANMSRIIQQAIRTYEEDIRIEELERIGLDNRMHRRVRAYTYMSTRQSIPDLTDSMGRKVTEDQEKAELLAKHFEDIQNIGQTFATGGHFARVTETVATLRNNEPLLGFGHQTLADGSSAINFSALIRPAEVGAALKRLNCKKSSGEDGIPNFILRKTGAGAWGTIAMLFNQCLNCGYFPKAWKCSRVVPVLKPGRDSTDCRGYRPISLLSNLGKLFEKLILWRMKEHIENNSILQDSQFGFRGGLSTNHALLALSDRISKGLNSKRITIAASLDFEKAFDTVWQDAIVYKMYVVQNFNQLIVRIILDYLSDRTFSVGIGDRRSSPCCIRAGVPQGSILGPVLYNLFLSDIPTPPDGQLMVIYADDILVASTHARAKLAEMRLNQFLLTLDDYFSKWRLRLNIPKCRSIIFKGRRSCIYKNARAFIPNIRIRDESIPNTNCIKYLGVVFQENLSFIKHVDHVQMKCRKAFMAYRKVLGGRRGLSYRVRLTLYKTIVRPTVAYAFPVWFGISSHQMERLRKMERKILRYCLGLRAMRDDWGNYIFPSCRLVYDRSGIERFDSFAVRTAIDFLEGTRCSTNSLLRECLVQPGEFDLMMGRNGFLTPMCLLELRDRNLIYDGNGNTVFYHRRYRTLNVNDLVYNTAQ